METAGSPNPALHRAASRALGLGFPKLFPPLRRASTPQLNGPHYQKQAGQLVMLIRKDDVIKGGNLTNGHGAL